MPWPSAVGFLAEGNGMANKTVGFKRTEMDDLGRVLAQTSQKTLIYQTFTDDDGRTWTVSWCPVLSKDANMYVIDIKR